ncbi:MAG: hypothetical protein AB7K71_36100 [Polyangiaceae bacterium]
MLTQTGCLLGETPEYQSRRQTPPLVVANGITPAPGRLIRARVSEKVEFTVNFRSEDAGETMSFLLWRNYQSDQAFYIDAGFVPPSSNLYEAEGDPTQALQTYTFGASDIGCNSYTLLLTHTGNLNGIKILPGTENDVASVTWWAVVEGLNGEPGDILVDDCGGVQ